MTNNGPPLSLSQRQLGVFLKAPLAGTVKTRLGATLGMAAAARIAAAFAADVLERMAGVADVDPWVFHAPAGKLECCMALIPVPIRSRLHFVAQTGGSLGDRMVNALEALLEAEPGVERGPPRRAVLIGSDLPTIDGERLVEAFDALDQHDLVLGPATDGGYYLIGMKVPCAALFEGVPWSTAAVLETTLRRAGDLGLAVALLPTERDVDDFADLEALWHCLRARRRAGLAVPARTWVVSRAVFDPESA